MRQVAAIALATFLAGNAANAACNQSSYREARLRCASSSNPKCEENVYRALEGETVSAMTDLLSCNLAVFGNAMKDANTGDSSGSQNAPSQPSMQPSPQEANSGRPQPNAFQGIAPFNSGGFNQGQGASPYPYPNSGLLPPSVVQMMQQMQSMYAPGAVQGQGQCQGVTTSKIKGYDQSGNQSSKSTLEKFEVIQIVRSQENNGRRYYLASNGFWYDAGYIKKSSGCNL